MLRRVDRILLRVPNVASATRFYREVMGLALLREDQRTASLKLSEDATELVLHSDPDLPAEAVYYLVESVRDLFERRAELKLTFIQVPAPSARGYRAAVKDPFGNVLLIMDRTLNPQGGSVVEDGKAPGALFPGMVEERVPARPEALLSAYQRVGRTADDLPYTPDFERLYDLYCAEHQQAKPTRQEVWRHLLNLRKAGKLPRLGEARTRPPAIAPEAREALLSLVGESIGRRDRLPYTDQFDLIVNEFNKTQTRPLSPHLVWRLVASLAK